MLAGEELAHDEMTDAAFEVLKGAGMTPEPYSPGSFQTACETSQLVTPPDKANKPVIVMISP